MRKIYLTKKINLDSDYKYTVVCTKHKTMLGVENKKIAVLTYTKDFCNYCE